MKMLQVFVGSKRAKGRCRRHFASGERLEDATKARRAKSCARVACKNRGRKSSSSWRRDRAYIGARVAQGPTCGWRRFIVQVSSLCQVLVNRISDCNAVALDTVAQITEHEGFVAVAFERQPANTLYKSQQYIMRETRPALG
ncbi:uncharacterized protein LAESUDRAFT_87394 [Laetiporus sulphureus 93-53]|uniref:Uncharacterized protein n=1 Tax=Laetiporus sulphureus 93-53 TaxID=1314785 RepID=A0A165EW10_9APHY|nr:uncharacterized protein LAESUDRAFT_87394 [Laetiporus sulphureus 93-53]KZT07885.1 hypothetical protein LAESUDRAFT_87394 [Laetiporus sulphureus 93-53]